MTQEQTDFQAMMTVKQVTEYLNISRQHLHTLTKENKIPFYKLGGAVRYRREDIEEYLKKSKQ